MSLFVSYELYYKIYTTLERSKVYHDFIYPREQIVRSSKRRQSRVTQYNINNQQSTILSHIYVRHTRQTIKYSQLKPIYNYN